MRSILNSLGFLLALLLITAATATASLRDEVNAVLSTSDATVGVALEVLETSETLSINGEAEFPMQSVYKFPIALALLRQVDAGRFKLDSMLLIRKRDLEEETWSPMRDKYPNANVRLSIEEIMRYMVAESDNNACDILIRLLGGPKKVQQILELAGVQGIVVASTERAMHEDWSLQFKNYSKPRSMVSLLRALHGGTLLSPASNAVLLEQMTNSNNSRNRIMANLPKGTPVAHKTGTSGFNEMRKIFAATNDVGIVTLPNGHHLAIAVFVSRSKKQLADNESVIARIAELAWRHYSAR